MPGKQRRGVPKPKPAPPIDANGLPAFITTDILASLTGVSGRRLHQLISDSRIPIECKKGAPEGFWHTSKTLVEIFGYYRRVADKTRPSIDVQMEREITMEDLRSKKLKNAKASRELLPVTIMAQIWGEMLASFKNKLLSFPSKMGARAFRAKDKVEATELLEAELRSILNGLPAEIEALASKIRDDDFSPDGGESNPTAAGSKSGDLVPENP